MSDPSARLKETIKGNKMTIYLVKDLTRGTTTRIVTDGDPTVHPCFHNHVLDVETVGEEGNLLSLV